jgi:hypothetical protein
MASPAPTDLTIQSSQQELGTKPNRPDVKMEEVLVFFLERSTASR